MSEPLAGKQHQYTLGVRLGSGGMAHVFVGAAVDEPGIQVAIKVPREDIPSEAREMFIREAEAASKVVNPHVVRVVDWGTDPPFIAFEFVEGGTLLDELRRRQVANDHWKTAELIGFYNQLVDAMRAVNEQVVHRDIKTENIFFCAGHLRVADFGLAKYAGEATRSRTFKNWGTFAYMSPEVWREETATWQADQYSLGVVFFELATLRRPFTGTRDELEQQHLFKAPALVTEIRSDLPVRLASLVRRMLGKLPRDRFGSWDELAEELKRIESPAEAAGVARLDEGLLLRAAKHVQAATERELEAQRAAEKAKKAQRERAELCEFWCERFFSEIRDRIEEINQEIGTKLTVDASNGRIRARFFSSTIELCLRTTPDEKSDVMVWGELHVSTSRRRLFRHLLLVTEPPYGRWLEVELRCGPMHAPGAFRGHAGVDALDDDVLRARDWSALTLLPGSPVITRAS